MSYHVNYRCYVETVSELLGDQMVQSMRRYRHHVDITCYEHSVFVSYVAFRLARWLKWDYIAAARGGLLHDLYLYDPADKTAHPGLQCFDHPKVALQNARLLCGALSAKEENIIISHMWPLARHMPHCREAVLVNCVDTLCATAEVLRLFHLIRKRNRLPAMAEV